MEIAPSTRGTFTPPASFEIAQVKATPPRPASSKARSFTDAMYLAVGGTVITDLSNIIQRFIPDSKAKRALELIEQSEIAKNIGKWEFDFPIHPANGIGHLNNISEYTIQLKLKVSSLGGTIRELKALSQIMPVGDLNHVLQVLERMDAAGRARGISSAQMKNHVDVRLMFHPPNNLRAAVFLLRDVDLPHKPGGSPGKASGLIFYSVRAPVTNNDPSKPGAQAGLRTSVGVELDLPVGKNHWMGLGMVRNSVHDNASSAGLARQGDRIGQIVTVNGKERFLAIPNGSLMAAAFGGANKVPVTKAPVISPAEFFAEEAKLSPKAKADVEAAQRALARVVPAFDQVGSGLHFAGAVASGNPVFAAAALLEASQKGHDDFYAAFRESKVGNSAQSMSQTIQAINRAWNGPSAGQAGNRFADMRTYVTGALGDAFSRSISDGDIGLYTAYGIARGLMNSKNPQVRNFGLNLVRGTVAIPFSNSVAGMNVRTDPRLQFIDRVTTIINGFAPKGKNYFGADRIPNKPQDIANALAALKADSPRNYNAALARLANREGVDFGVWDWMHANRHIRTTGFWQGPRGSVEPINVERHVDIIEGRRR